MLPKQPNQSLIDGVRCLQAVINHETPAGVLQISAELGMESTRVHRLLRTLTHTGLLQRNASRKYSSGPALPVLAAQTLHAIKFGERVVPPLEELRGKLKLIVAAGVLWEQWVSYLYHANPDKKAESAIGSHKVWPAIKSGIGMTLLACKGEDEIRSTIKIARKQYPGGMTGLLKELRKIRSQGYAYVATERGHHTLALPLESNANIAIGVSGLLTQSGIPAVLHELRECVHRIDGFNTATGI